MQLVSAFCCYSLPRLEIITNFCYFQTSMTLASLCRWAGRFESYKVAQLRRQIFSWRGTNELRHENTWLRGLRPGKTQTSLRSHRSWVEAWNFWYYTIPAANNKGADQTARMHRLSYAFVVRIWHKKVFSYRGTNNHENKTYLGIQSYLFVISEVDKSRSLRTNRINVRLLNVFG